MARFRDLATALSASVCIVALATPAQAQERSYNIPAGSLRSALDAYVAQSGTQLIYQPQDLGNAQSKGVAGIMTPQVALDRLLAGSGFRSVSDRSGALAIVGNGSSGVTGAATEIASSLGEDALAEGQQGISEILVVGSRSQNVDIRRTEDDAQPYVVFGQEQIQRSNSTDLEDFIRKMLPMSTTKQLEAQNDSSQNSSTLSNINLRGLGINQTLILIDGKRPARPSTYFSANDFLQPDINGIPLASIERIEVLPSTGGGIYGGGAVGGVINIIRKRDYSAITLNAGLDGTFRGGGEKFTLAVSGGFSPDGGRTSISFGGQYTHAKPLYAGDNDLWRRGRELFIENTAVPVFSGYTTNIYGSGTLVLDTGPSFGTLIAHVPEGYAGVATDGGVGLIPGAGTLNVELSDDVRGTHAALRPKNDVKSINLNVRHSFVSWLDGYVDGTYVTNRSERGFITPAALGTLALSPNVAGNPFNRLVNVRFPLVGLESSSIGQNRNYGATAGLIFGLGSRWKATADLGWHKVKTTRISGTGVNRATFEAAIRNGQVDIFRDLNAFPIDFTPYLDPSTRVKNEGTTSLRSGSLRASGPALRLPGGDVRLTALLEQRTETAETATTNNPNGGVGLIPKRSQRVRSAYAEFVLPIFSQQNRRKFIESLELQLSARHDRYRTMFGDPISVDLLSPDDPLPAISRAHANFSSTDFTVAAMWAPHELINFRASYSTGFLPPAIGQLVPQFDTQETFIATLLDPRRGNTPVQVPYETITAGNPDLEPESSKSFSAGLIVRPISGVRMSLDYTRIKKDQEIGLASISAIVANESAFPGRVIRGTKNPGDPAAWAGPIVSLDSSLMNLFQTDVSAWDLQLDYETSVFKAGELHLFLVATHQNDFIRQTAADEPAFEYAGFNDGPLKWRASSGAELSIGNWSINWYSQYFHSYSVRSGRNPTNPAPVISHGRARIPSQMYHDLGVRYRIPNMDRIPALGGTEISFGIQNIFNKRPPVTPELLSGYSDYGDARLRRFTLRVSKEIAWQKP